VPANVAAAMRVEPNQWTGQVEVVNLSTSGAGVRGPFMPAGTEITLSFTPPGYTQPISIPAVVVREAEEGRDPVSGVAFRLTTLVLKE
jgi:hypothetical protein